MNSGRGQVAPSVRRFRIAATLAVVVASCSIAPCGPIHDAARKGDRTKVIALLSQNPDLVASRDKFGNTPLHVAAQYNQAAIAALLIANGADVNAQSTLLLVQDPDPKAQSTPISEFRRTTRSAETPLTLALLSYEHKEMVELLLTHGANVNIMLADGDTPLHRAVRRDLPYDVELLLANGADPNARGFNWQSPLHLAVLHGRTHILEILLDYGADPNAKDLGGYTPMFYAQSNSYQKAVELLRAHGGQ